MKYYKVVAQHNKKLCSAIWAKLAYKCAPLRYIKNKWTYPVIDGSKLFVFDDVFYAEDFADAFPELHLVVYECEVKNPMKVNSDGLISNMGSLDLKEYWKAVTTQSSIMGIRKHLTIVKPHTILCDAVMITKRITD